MAEKFGDRYKVYQYTITYDPNEADNGHNYPIELQKLIEKAYQLVVRKKRDAIPRLQKLAIKYPHVPAFKNYLASYYIEIGNEEKAYEANRWLSKEHPNYLYGRLNLAGQYLEEGKYEKMKEALGPEMELQELYPERKIFHLGEYKGFFNLSCRYFIATNELDIAENRIEAAEQVLPDTKLTDLLRGLIEEKRQELLFEEEEKFNRKPKGREHDPAKQTEVKPSFIHSEIEQLYVYDLDIDPDILRSILALPTATLFQDLQAVLADSVNRYEYFVDRGLDEQEHYFPLHALFLLTELGTKESLPIILNYLKNGDYLLSFWLDDHYTETLWELVYSLGQNELDLLKNYLFEPNVCEYSKGTVTDAVSQIAHHQPERRTEIINWYKEVFHYFFDNIDNEDLIDTGLISFMVSDVLDLAATELSSEIETAYAQNLVSPFMMGPYEEVCSSLKNAAEFFPQKRQIFASSYERYKHINDTWHFPISAEEYNIGLEQKLEKLKKEKAQTEEELRALQLKVVELKMRGEGFEELEDIGKSILPKVSSNSKVGRNEPCPCGSGKKYKKCCLRK